MFKKIFLSAVVLAFPFFTYSSGNLVPTCDILDNPHSGVALMKGSTIIGLGYSLSKAYEELEYLLDRGECRTSFNRSCFYTDSLGRGDAPLEY